MELNGRNMLKEIISSRNILKEIISRTVLIYTPQGHRNPGIIKMN
jgi:hypothetical protein